MRKFLMVLLMVLFSSINSPLTYAYGGPSRIPIFANQVIMNDNIGLLIGINKNITNYNIKVDYDATQIEIEDVIDVAKLGSFSLTKTNGSLTITDCGVNIYNANNGLFFIPIVLKANINVHVNLRFIIESQTFYVYFKKGKIINDDGNNYNMDITINDAVAGLRYLAGTKNTGNSNGTINLINMAFITSEPDNNKLNKPNIKSAIALMQYLAGIRDGNMNLKVN